MIENFTTIAVTAGFHGIFSTFLYLKKTFFLLEDLPQYKISNNEPVHHWICSNSRDKSLFQYNTKDFLQTCGSIAQGTISHNKRCNFCIKYADMPDADYKKLYKRNQYLNVASHICVYGVVCIYIPSVLITSYATSYAASYYTDAQKDYMNRMERFMKI